MAKYLCLSSLGIAGFLLLLFLVDLILKFPFTRIDVTVDILGVLACGIVGYLSWDAYRELC